MEDLYSSNGGFSRTEMCLAAGIGMLLGGAAGGTAAYLWSKPPDEDTKIVKKKTQTKGEEKGKSDLDKVLSRFIETQTENDIKKTARDAAFFQTIAESQQKLIQQLDNYRAEVRVKSSKEPSKIQKVAAEAL